MMEPDSMAQPAVLCCVEFPKSEYIFLDDFPLRSNNTELYLLIYNIRSISSNFQYFLDTVLSCQINFDVLGLTETRLNAYISPLYTLPEYEMFTNNRNRFGGGVVIHISSKFASFNITDFL